MSDPYVEWIEKEAASEKAKATRTLRERHTPPDTVPMVSYTVLCPEAKMSQHFESLNDATNYIRSLLIAGIPGLFQTVVRDENH